MRTIDVTDDIVESSASLTNLKIVVSEAGPYEPSTDSLIYLRGPHTGLLVNVRSAGFMNGTLYLSTTPFAHI